MSLILGQQKVGSLYLGNTKISKAYLGNNEVFSGVKEPWKQTGDWAADGMSYSAYNGAIASSTLIKNMWYNGSKILKGESVSKPGGDLNNFNSSTVPYPQWNLSLATHSPDPTIKIIFPEVIKIKRIEAKFKTYQRTLYTVTHMYLFEEGNLTDFYSVGGYTSDVTKTYSGNGWSTDAISFWVDSPDTKDKYLIKMCLYALAIYL